MNKTLLVVVLWFASGIASAVDHRIRVHHFLPESAPLHADFLVKWAEAIEKESQGRLAVEIYPRMVLGGKPSDLYDQARDGLVDVVLTLPGYTAGRFLQSEVFELPFLMEDSVATSRALWDFIESDLQEAELSETKVLAGWVHGNGVLHTRQRVANVEDLRGMSVRAPTRLAAEYLRELGANPQRFPLPSIPEKIESGEISGTLLPWEVTPSIKLGQIVKNHLEIDDTRAIYTSVFVLSMNWESYRGLPSDLRLVLQKYSGKKLSAFAGEVMASADAYGKTINASNRITVITGEEADKWILGALPLYDRWFEYAERNGFDGSSTLAKARELIQYNRGR